MYFKRSAVYLLAVLIIFAFQLADAQEEPARKHKHHLTNAEKALMPSYLQVQRQRAQTPAPPAPVRSIAEFEPMEGVLVAYPLGIPAALVAQISQEVVVTTIVDGPSQENQARSLYDSSGANLNNCNFLHAPHDSYWTRDYGPWFIADGNGNIGIMDFIYNRPRPSDNNIPTEMADFLNIDLYGMNLTQAGGNYMTDGMGIAVSTDLVWDENGSYSHVQIEQIMQDYLGISTYHVRDDPTGDYIKHVDCWGKYLYVDKVLIAQVPQSNSQYNDYETTTTYFSNQISGHGNPYRVYRVSTPNSQPYTNSLIVNNRVFVPITGSSADSGAVDAYEAAMPGYTVIGVSGDWQSTDALHCRVKGIADRDMVYIKHMPLLGEKPAQSSYDITADIVPYSGQAVDTNALKVYYRVNGGSYISVGMTHAGGDTYTGSVPGQSQGSEIAYYISAADVSGISGKHPFIGAPDPHTFTAGGITPGAPVAQFSADNTTVTVGTDVQFTDQSTNGPTSWSWTFDGGTPSTSTGQNPVVTYNTVGTYTVTLTVSNAQGSDTETGTNYITVQDTGSSYCESSGNSYNYEWIAGVQVGDLNHSSGALGYADYTGQTAALTAGANVTVSLTPGFASGSYSEYWSIWIDYNMDGDFDDPGEGVFSDSGSSTVSGSFTVPSSAAGVTRMRVSMRYGSSPSACGSFDYGEVEDYSVDIGGGTVQPPTAGFIAASTSIGVGESVAFTDQSTNGPTSWSWTFDGGSPSSSSAQNPTVIYNTVGTYNVTLTVTNSAGSDTETRTGYIAVTDTPVTYCTASGNNIDYEWIAGVQLGSIDNSSGGSGYTDFTSISSDLVRGGSLSVSLTPGFASGSYSEFWKIWIDYNGDGDFGDPGEEVFADSGSSAVSGSFTVPTSAIAGTTRMRIIMKYNAHAPSCGTFDYGEVEDYSVNIQ